MIRYAWKLTINSDGDWSCLLRGVDVTQVPLLFPFHSEHSVRKTDLCATIDTLRDCVCCATPMNLVDAKRMLADFIVHGLKNQSSSIDNEAVWHSGNWTITLRRVLIRNQPTLDSLARGVFVTL